MNRVYLPEEWLREEKADVEDLCKSVASKGLRAVMDRCLNATEELLTVAHELPRKLKSKRLAMESCYYY